MNRPCYEVLAAASLAGYENGGVQARDPFYLLEDPKALGALSHYVRNQAGHMLLSVELHSISVKTFMVNKENFKDYLHRNTPESPETHQNFIIRNFFLQELTLTGKLLNC